jgi:hypothetical protein
MSSKARSAGNCDVQEAEAHTKRSGEALTWGAHQNSSVIVLQAKPCRNRSEFRRIDFRGSKHCIGRSQAGAHFREIASLSCRDSSSSSFHRRVPRYAGRPSPGADRGRGLGRGLEYDPVITGAGDAIDCPKS